MGNGLILEKYFSFLIQKHKLLKCGKEENWSTRRGMMHELEKVKNCFCSDVHVWSLCNVPCCL